MKKNILLAVLLSIVFVVGNTNSIFALDAEKDVLSIDNEKNSSELISETSPIPLKILPKDKNGIIDWDSAVAKGYIKPLGLLYPEIEKPEIDKVYTADVFIKMGKGTESGVIFSHKTHTYWFDCNGCHPSIFTEKQGGNLAEMNMDKMKEGKSCGKCHNKVAFSLNNCSRCHKKTYIQGKPSWRSSTPE